MTFSDDITALGATTKQTRVGLGGSNLVLTFENQDSDLFWAAVKKAGPDILFATFNVNSTFSPGTANEQFVYLKSGLVLHYLSVPTPITR